MIYRISLSYSWIFLMSSELSSNHCRHFARSAANKTNWVTLQHLNCASLRVCCIWGPSTWVMWNGLYGIIQLRNEQTEYKQLLPLSTSYKWTLIILIKWMQLFFMTDHYWTCNDCSLWGTQTPQLHQKEKISRIECCSDDGFW